jgi:hypothetical protein
MQTVEWTATRILGVLDASCANVGLPVLGNAYVYLAAARLALYRSADDWALVVETFGFMPRVEQPDTTVWTVASRLHRRNPASAYVSEAAYLGYLAQHPHDDMRAVWPLDADGWQDVEDTTLVGRDARSVRVRGRPVAIPAHAELRARGIEPLDERRVHVFELCRHLASVAREDVLADEHERRVSVPPDLRLLLSLDEWRHPDIAGGELPSDVGSFRQLAQVLATGDARSYQPSEPPNTDWKHWPSGGTG